MTLRDAPPPAPAPVAERRAALGELARVFLTLGTVAFGGPAAHVALMEDAIVRRRRWLTREQFLDRLGATQLIPGPNSTELALHVGYARAGWAGLVVAGVCFIVPAALLVGAIAWAYGRWGTRPEAAWLLHGVQPVVVAVVAQALWGLGRTALKSRALGAVGVGAVAAVVGGVHELAVLAGAGALTAVLARRAPSRAATDGGATARDDRAAWLPPSVLPPSALVSVAGASSVANVASAAPAVLAPVGPWPLFAVFAKIGAVLFGSGYVLLAFLRADLVERLGWLTERQLLDAVAVGQVTPGPVFTTATFVGYVVGGAGGAVAATVGIFLPAFAFVAASGPLVPRLRGSAVAGAVLDGVNVASLALMAVVAAQLARVALVDALTVALAIASAGLLIRFRVNSAWLVLGGGAIGVAAGAIGAVAAR